MNDADDPVTEWVRTAREYLTDVGALVDRHGPAGSLSRPTAVLHGYFLENVLKAVIIRRSRASANECYEHIGAKLVALAGMSLRNQTESQLLEDLRACVLWGKYPEPGKGSTAGLVRSGNTFFANETYVFNDVRVFAHLMQFSIRALDHASDNLCNNTPPELDAVTPMLESMRHQAQYLMDSVERR